MESMSCPLTPKSQSLISPREFTRMLEGLTSAGKRKLKSGELTQPGLGRQKSVLHGQTSPAHEPQDTLPPPQGQPTACKYFVTVENCNPPYHFFDIVSLSADSNL